jgi:arabinose-5-phosphate isomerase
MRSGESLPQVGPSTGFSDMMRVMSGKGLGAAAITDPEGKVLGIFTDGDLRRLIEKGADMRGMTARDVMHTRPKTIHPEALAAEAAQVMEQHRITLVLVVDANGHLVGAINSNDLLRAKVI